MNKTTNQKLQGLVMEALREEKEIESKTQFKELNEAGREGLKKYLQKVAIFQDVNWSGMTKRK